MHHNSTVLSKALYLASEGGVHNGCFVPPLGVDKTEQILYRARKFHLSGAETFNSAFLDLLAACGALYGAESEDCANLRKALQSVEMDQTGTCSDPSRAQRQPPGCRAPTCERVVYHGAYNPNEPTFEDRRNLCLRLGYKYAGVVLNMESAAFDWYGNCRPEESREMAAWNTDPYYTLDLSTCGPAPVFECVDSDGGVEYEEYFVSGRTGKSEAGPFFDQDYCQKGGDPNKPSRAYYVSSCGGADPECNLIETKCGQYGGTYRAYHCPNGCAEGRCLQ